MPHHLPRPATVEGRKHKSAFFKVQLRTHQPKKPDGIAAHIDQLGPAGNDILCLKHTVVKLQCQLIGSIRQGNHQFLCASAVII